MNEATDRAQDVRPGEELDAESLLTFLVERLEFPDDVELQIRQFRSGHSNLTYLLEPGEERSLVLRRPPFGAEDIERGHDMSREWRVLSALEGHFEAIPSPIAFCEDTSVIGAPFYLMERVEGAILRGPRPSGIEWSEERAGALSETFVETLVSLHDVDLEASGLEDFGRPEGYVERQIEGWTARYRKAQTDEIESIDEAAAWLADHMPADSSAALIHNDFKYDNLVFDPDDLGHVRAILDWEMATVGDPLMDLGTSLAYWVEASDSETVRALQFGPTSLPGSLDREGVARRYAELSGRDISEVLFYYVYGLFKVAVIGQQIYYRFEKGYTDDERFAMLIHAVRALGDQARRAIGSGRISETAS
jgi:aminoglycoside phosphotransferase (APT) family kinase protein